MKRALPDDIGTLVALMAEFYAESRTPRRRQIRADPAGSLVRHAGTLRGRAAIDVGS